MDPVTALATASTAFNLIKKGFQAGRDVESMYGDIGKWLGAVSDVNHAEKMSKNPPLFKKLFLGSTVEQEAMDAFAAKKKAEAMEEELRNWINLTHGPNAWSDLLKMQAKIRKQRQEQLYAQQEMRARIFNIIGIIFLCTIVGGFFDIFSAWLTSDTAPSHFPISPYIDSTSRPAWNPFFIKLNAVEAVAKAVTGSIQHYILLQVGEHTIGV